MSTESLLLVLLLFAVIVPTLLWVFLAGKWQQFPELPYVVGAVMLVVVATLMWSLRYEYEPVSTGHPEDGSGNYHYVIRRHRWTGETCHLYPDSRQGGDEGRVYFGHACEGYGSIPTSR